MKPLIWPGERVTRPVWGPVQPVFRSELVTGVQVEAGPLLAADLADTPGSDFLVARNRVDNSLGRVDFTITQTHPAPATSDGGILARVTFLAINPVQSDVSLADVILSNIEGTAILASPSGATVTVSPSIFETLPPSTERPSPIPTIITPTLTVAVATAAPSPTPPAGPATTTASTAQPTKTAPPEPTAEAPSSDAGGPAVWIWIVVGLVIGVVVLGGGTVLVLRRRTG